MVTLNQVKTGLQNFLEKEFIPVLPGWKKAAVATALALYLRNFPNIAQSFFDTPFGKFLGVYKDGMVDIDSVYEEALKQFESPVTVDIPAIGSVSLTKDNLTNLYNMIKEVKA